MIIYFTVLAFALVFLGSCDYVDLTDFIKDTEEEQPEKHQHSYGEILGDYTSHYRECSCGDIVESYPHADVDLDGFCDGCKYSIRELMAVTVEADEHVNLTDKRFEVVRGETFEFIFSVGSEYEVSLDGAEMLSKEEYGTLIIYTARIERVQRDITVAVKTELAPIVLCAHSWVPATCTAAKACMLCGETDGEALEHSMSEATCTAPAICTVCGETDGEALGHSMSEATCTSPAICTVCGETDGEALGHSMSEATCIAPAICTVCGETDGEALGHSMSEATCTSPAICTVCGETDGEALGHSMSEATCTSPAICTVCGETDGEALGHSMTEPTCQAPSTCSRCGITEGDALPHNYKASTLSAPTCTEEGYDLYACACGRFYQTVIPATGHEGGEPTFISEGICKKCNEVYLPMLKLTYSSYGAVGDGVTDDFSAIKAAHAYANANGITVYADPGKTYYLGQHNDTITVKTNTVWDGATFIIDDRSISPTSQEKGRNVFFVAPDAQSYNVRIDGGLMAGQENIGVTFNTPVLLYIANSGVKQYIRYGANANSGTDQQELILVDEYGNVDPSTPIMWNYDVITSAIAYPVGDAPISITGGTFITRANAAPREYTYYARNISIKRSNVTVTGLTHLITDEGDTGAPYNGFINISYCNNVLIENTVFTGHKVYKLSSDANNSMGTYDIALNSANAVTFKNCTQTNSITDTKYWGVMGSNFCKNLTYDGCIFSRFDAHQGTYNATIINSEIGHQKLSVIGQGTLYIENTVFHSDTVVALRTDYGSTWQGEIVFKNITINNTGTPILVNAGWNNHYFGYTCYLPTKIIVDGVTLANKDYFYVLPNLASHVDDVLINGAENKNPLQLTETIIIRSNPNGYKYYVSVNKELFANVELIVE